MNIKKKNKKRNKLVREIKKKFLKNVNQISDDIFTLREQEINLKEKENKLTELENSYNKMALKSDFSFEELNELYTLYKKIMINHEKLSLKIADKENVNFIFYELLKDFKLSSSSFFFQNIDEYKIDEQNSLITDDWNDLIKDYVSEYKENIIQSNQILFQTRDNRMGQNMKSHSQERKINNSDENATIQRLKTRFKENVQNQEMEGYINLEKYSYQKHLLKCHENKDRVRQLFDNHSSWLKNMRNEVVIIEKIK